jgi:cysteine desulfurase / selenocysteine lyase
MIPKSDMMIDEGISYLNNAAIGLLPRSTYDILIDQIKGHASKGLGAFDVKNIEDSWGDVRKSVASLINGSHEGITLTSNTASALHIVIDGLHKEYTPHQNIVITELEFTTNSFPWQMLAKRHRMELRVIPFRSGNFLEQDWEHLVDDNTKFVSVSHVQYSNGYRSDLKYLSDLSNSHGAYLVVDAIQSIGAIPVDVVDLGVDFLASGGYKWQLGPMNTGFFYSNPEHLDKLESYLVGWFSSSNFHDMSHNTFTPWEDARRFQQSFDFRFLALRNSFRLLKRYDVEKIYNHIIDLQDYLIKRLDEVEGFSIGSSLEPKKRSGIIRLNREKNDTLALVEYLGVNNVYVAERDGGLRISPHGFNTKEDIDRLIEGLIAWNLIT